MWRWVIGVVHNKTIEYKESKFIYFVTLYLLKRSREEKKEAQTNISLNILVQKKYFLKHIQ